MEKAYINEEEYNKEILNPDYTDIIESNPIGIIGLKTAYSQKSIYFRPNTSDIAVFRQVFVQDEYNYNYILEPNHNIRYIIDCGANVGYSSIWFAHKYPNAIIIAIEPDVENYKILQLNCSHFNNIKTLHAAVWNRKSKIDLCLFDDSTGKQFEKWAFRTAESTNCQNEKVQAYSISDLIQKYDIPFIDILKIDIEGAEKEIFQTNYLKWIKITNSIVIELHDRFRPGCREALLTAIENISFSIQEKDNICFLKRK